MGFIVYALHPNSNPRFIGTVSMYRIDHYYGNSCEVGIVMSADHFGTGLARDAMHAVLEYAFEELKFHRVVFHTVTDNKVVRGWLERMDAVLEGIERDAWSDGKGGYKDVCLYSALKPHWLAGGKARMERGMRIMSHL
jgi:RimJ/RimL family protein N-acetyltransferase